ncbi:MAG TPA: cation:proton antiporter [Methanoculleus sp.]|nr:cation:proton antiporter [Methanoculleus sp.]
MKSVAATALLAFLVYLLLTAGSGHVLFWSWAEIVAGLVIGLVVGGLSASWFCSSGNMRMAHPFRWLLLAIYSAGPLFVEIIRANVYVSISVITGNIRPGIVKFNPGINTDLGKLLLATSITLTPGTLTVEVDDATGVFYVHMLNVDEKAVSKEMCDTSDIFAFFNLPAWIWRIAE